ncbi:MAG: DUF2141 domain-containing protein [Sphingobium sp.]|nr:DUF2141 domain-containing protein [Sphingobium sp.]MCP5399513.1 DUF2141 domain-containing protein [Sphingomonas sp.]
MASIFASGTKYAARISALAIFPLLIAADSPDKSAAISVRAPASVAAEAAGGVDVHFEGLRSDKGMIRICLTRDEHYFPKCEDDPLAYKASISASDKTGLHIEGVAPGDYALLVLHDENGNARLDKMLGIPREGVGFSGNPRLLVGPPSFEKVRFRVEHRRVSQDIRLKYFL